MSEKPTPLPVAVKPSLIPNGGLTSQKWDTIKLAIRLSCVVLLTAAIVGFLLLSGKNITVEQIILLIVAGGGLAGLTAARPSGGAGGGGASVLGAALLMLVTVLGGCGAAQHVPSADDCTAEATIVQSVAAAIDAADLVVPADAEDRDEIFASLRSGVTLGEAAITACEAARDESPWMAWVGVGLKILRGVAELLRALDLPLPSVLGDAIDLLVLEQEAGPPSQSWAGLPPIEREPPWDVAVAL